MTKKVLIVGGVACGASEAARLHRWTRWRTSSCSNAVNTDKRTVTVRRMNGDECEVSFDALVLSPGARRWHCWAAP